MVYAFPVFLFVFVFVFPVDEIVFPFKLNQEKEKIGQAEKTGDGFEQGIPFHKIRKQKT